MKLSGTCNLCGLCCFSADGASKCSNLVLTSLAGGPNGTYCAVYKDRYDGMPIRMLDRDGNETSPGKHYCAKDSDAETAAIIEKGIRAGYCSLEIQEDGVK